MEYTISRVTTPEGTSKVETFVHDHFLPEMPLILAFGLQDAPPTRAPSQQRPGTEDFSLQALDSCGDIVGVAINKFNPTFSVEPTTPESAEAVKNMSDFMKYVDENAHLDTLPERTIELRILSVRKDWRKRGLARKLAEESMRVAKDAGFQAMSVCCTSEYTAMLARSLGWREHYRVKYQEYSGLSGRQVQVMPSPPHEHLYYYVTDLVNFRTVTDDHLL